MLWLNYKMKIKIGGMKIVRRFIRMLVAVLKLLIKGLYFFLWWLPNNLPILTFICYVLILYGSFYLFGFEFGLREMKRLFGEFWGQAFFLLTVIPLGISFFHSLHGPNYGPSKGNSQSDSLDAAIEYRNNLMENRPPHKAVEILRKTAALDMMKYNNQPGMKNAKMGFHAKYGRYAAPRLIDKFLND